MSRWNPGKLLTLLLALPSIAFAQSSPNWPLGYQPSMPEWNAEWASKLDYGQPGINNLFASPPPLGSVAPNTGAFTNFSATGTTTTSGISNRVDLYATELQADGMISDDVVLSAAAANCTSVGGTLHLPAGQIKLTGAAQIRLSNCNVVGAGVPGPAGVNSPGGTSFLLTSTSVMPFIGGEGWGLSGVNFYHPNQTAGSTVYPPIIGDDGVHGWSHVAIDRVTVFNAYDAFKATPGVGWGDVSISNSYLWATDDALSLSSVGDFFTLTNVTFSPGPILNLCAFAQPCLAAVNYGAAHNRIFHITNLNGASAGVVLTGKALNAFAWRYGILVDSGARMELSTLDFNWDGIGTIVDASSGGAYVANTAISGNGPSCLIEGWGSSPNAGGNNPCYTMGANSALTVDGYNSNAPNHGSFIVTSGSAVTLMNSQVAGIGAVADGADYYIIQDTGTTANIFVRGNALQGLNASTHVHGIKTSAATPQIEVIQNNFFNLFNDALDLASAPETVITGNTSAGTAGSATIVQISGSNNPIYANNLFDKPPMATVANCGGGTPSVHGGLAGFLTTGTGLVTSCQLLLPSVPYGSGGGNCTFQNSAAPTVFASPAGPPPTWTLTFSSSNPSTNVFYNCPGQQ